MSKETLSDARTRFFLRAENDGMNCPCCGRFGRFYRRKFNSGMALSVIWLVWEFRRISDGSWIDVAKTAPPRVLRSREFDKLLLWGLIEKCCDADSGDTSSILGGLWRPMPIAARFVDGLEKIPSHAVFWNNSILRFEDGRCDVGQALREKFDYDELMRGVFPGDDGSDGWDG